MSAVLKRDQEQIEPPHDITLSIPLTDAHRRAMLANGAALRLAESYVIDCHEVAETAAAEILTINKQIAGIKTMYEDLGREPKSTLSKLKAWFMPGITEREMAIDIIKERLKGWDAQERTRIAVENKQREEAAAKIRREAEARARAEEDRAQQIARDKQREADEQEAKRKQAEADGNTRAAAAAAAARGRAEQEAAAAFNVGAAKAEQHHLAAAASAIGAAPVEQARVAGATMRDNWIAKLKPDTTEAQARALIVTAAANNPMLLGVIEINESALNKLAKGLHEAFDVPGYVAVNDRLIAGKRK